MPKNPITLIKTFWSGKSLLQRIIMVVIVVAKYAIEGLKNENIVIIDHIGQVLNDFSYQLE